MKIQFFSCTNHVSSGQQAHVASSCGAGQCRSRLCPSFIGYFLSNARPVFSRPLRKQTPQSLFPQIDYMTASKMFRIGKCKLLKERDELQSGPVMGEAEKGTGKFTSE